MYRSQKHHSVEKEAMGQIPNVCVATVGCRVKKPGRPYEVRIE
jgi:hypothetical protein